MEINAKVLGVFAAAASFRLGVFLLFPGIADTLSNQVELSTPVSSFKTLKEGLFLYDRGVSPYDGGVFHQAPLLLPIFSLFPSPLLFTILDLWSALQLGRTAHDLRLSSPRFKKLDGLVISAAYLFSPFTIMSCLGRSTSVLGNAAIVQAVYSAQQGDAMQSMFSLAFSGYLTMYPALLLPPIVLFMAQSAPAGKSTPSGLVCAGYFSVAVLVMILLTTFITGDIAEFIRSCYGFQLTVPDLTPNIGLWWYFFIEMFDPFRSFFIGVFWLHMACYTGGMTLRLQKEPLFVITSLLGLFAIFKPYPNIADIALFLAFLPMYQHIVPCELSQRSV